jgi:glycine/D-amino acid oxidase-like deaminating enzyme
MSPSRNSAAKNVIVVGAGIIGASIAWHLARKGAAVTVVATKSGGTATPNSFAWINASWGNPEFYFRFRRRSMAEWTRLAKDVPALPLRWCGGLCWDLPRDDLEAYATEHGDWGYGIKVVGAKESAVIEPGLAEPPTFAVHVGEEGSIEPEAAAKILLADALRQGAAFLPDVEVLRLVVKNGSIVGIETANGILKADEIVLAAGAGTVSLAASAGIDVPASSPAGLLVHSRPYRPVLNGLLLAEQLHMRQTLDNRIVAGSDYGGTDPGENPEQAAGELFSKVKAMLRDADDLEMDFFTLGYRPTPVDGLPIIGRAGGVQGLYLAVMHSGVTLAPLVGLSAAAEIVDGSDDQTLEPFRLARFG